MKKPLLTAPEEMCAQENQNAIPVDSKVNSSSKSEIDFSLIDNPTPNPNIGLFTIKEANEWIDEASQRSKARMLFGQLWYENEICILFSDSNLGKSILAVQIADAISKGSRTMGMTVETDPQMVLYFDFELSDMQFELRYKADDGGHYRFSPNLKRVEISPNKLDDSNEYDFEEYIKLSLEQTVEELGVKVIILDNITYLSRTTEKASDALSLMKWLKAFGIKYGLSILVLAHTPKRNQMCPITKNDLQGSKMLYNFCDGCFAIGESSKDKNLRYIKELKQRNVPIRYDANNVIVCEIIKDYNFLQFIPKEYDREHEHLKEYDESMRTFNIERVKELSAQGKSQRDISRELGISLSSVNRYLNK